MLIRSLVFHLSHEHSYIVVNLTDSVLAFHKHGMQGRSIKDNKIVQEIVDDSRIFKLLGSDG